MPKTIIYTEEEFESYLHKKNPELDDQIKVMEDKLKYELGVRKERFPSPPPGWNLRDALAKDDDRPKIYRWIDENGGIQISRKKPKDGTKLLGWRYLPQPQTTPSPTPDNHN